MRSFHALSLLLLLASCIPSLHPLYRDRVQDTVALPELLGTWTYEGDGVPLDRSYWKVRQGAGKTYLFEILNKGRISHLEAHVVEIDGEYYLDTYPNKMVAQQELGQITAAHLVPTHIIWHMVPEGDGFDLHLMSEGAGGFKSQVIGDATIAPRAVIENGQMPVFTGGPEQLQEMLRARGPEAVFSAEPTVELRQPHQEG